MRSSSRYRHTKYSCMGATINWSPAANPTWVLPVWGAPRGCLDQRGSCTTNPQRCRHDICAGARYRCGPCHVAGKLHTPAHVYVCSLCAMCNALHMHTWHLSGIHTWIMHTVALELLCTATHAWLWVC
jgi:hypothetical protein